MRWTILVIAAFFLAVSLPPAGAAPAARPHAGIGCTGCHRSGTAGLADPAGREVGAAGCVACHRGYEAVFARAMGTRSGEQVFVRRSWGRHDSGFFAKNCNGCHLSGCRDCHGSGHGVRRPLASDCQQCHKGYFIGWDYAGRAPREENMRYQRGVAVNGETFLKMLPDVHYRKGMECGACHTMQSLMGGRGARGCRECHTPDVRVLEHRIAAHLERLECSACHAAWSAQEYGTFYLRFRSGRGREGFDLRPQATPEYLKSAYLKRQDLPPLGLNAAGRVAPIRPQFIALYTDIDSAAGGGRENLLLAAEWRAFSPHTIQRGTTMCEGCHDSPARFLLEPPEKRIYRLRKDGVPLDSFWSRTDQRMTNGSFLPAERYRRLSAQSPAYTKAYLEKWRTFLNLDAPSSRP